MGAFVHELFRIGIYKRSQGRIARQVTFAALAVILGWGAWSLSEYYQAEEPTVRYFVPMVVLFVGLWASFRIVQMPNFADFLIAVEGEMNKVAWPSRSELFRASTVVIVMIFLLAAILFVYDLIWKALLGRLLD